MKNITFNCLYVDNNELEFYLLPFISFYKCDKDGWNIYEITIGWLFWNIFISND